MLIKGGRLPLPVGDRCAEAPALRLEGPEVLVDPIHFGYASGPGEFIATGLIGHLLSGPGLTTTSPDLALRGKRVLATAVPRRAGVWLRRPTAEAVGGRGLH